MTRSVEDLGVKRPCFCGSRDQNEGSFSQRLSFLTVRLLQPKLNNERKRSSGQIRRKCFRFWLLLFFSFKSVAHSADPYHQVSTTLKLIIVLRKPFCVHTNWRRTNDYTNEWMAALQNAKMRLTEDLFSITNDFVYSPQSQAAGWRKRKMNIMSLWPIRQQLPACIIQSFISESFTPLQLVEQCDRHTINTCLSNTKDCEFLGAGSQAWLKEMYCLLVQTKVSGGSCHFARGTFRHSEWKPPLTIA